MFELLAITKKIIAKGLCFLTHHYRPSKIQRVYHETSDKSTLVA